MSGMLKGGVTDAQGRHATSEFPLAELARIDATELMCMHKGQGPDEGLKPAVIQ